MPDDRTTGPIPAQPVTTPDPAPLPPEALDELARVAVAQAQPVRIDLVASAVDLERVMRLRQDAVLELGWVAGDPLDAGLECDEHDQHALHVAAWDGDEVIGTVRVVLPVDGVALPTEQAFGITVEPPGQIVDWGRLVIHPRARGDGHGLMVGLLGRAWLATREVGALGCIGVASPAILELYRTLGVHATVLAGPRRYWGEERFAARLAGVSGDAGQRMGLHTSTEGGPGAVRQP